MAKKRNIFNQVKTLFKIFIISIIYMAIIGFSVKYFYPEETQTRIELLEDDIQYLRTTVIADSIRQYNTKKIISIINRFNPEMVSSLKYEIADEIYRMSIKHSKLDMNLICAVITYESACTWDPKIVSPAGAMGLMQLMPATGVYVARNEGITLSSAEEILFDPIYNIRIGCRYLSGLIDKYDVDGGLAAYNGGWKRVTLWLARGKADNILWAETRNYIPAVKNLYVKYQALTNFRNWDIKID